ncbi:MAG TPA: mechanosensitive ion channel family protein [Phycisphaerales bacterium]|nr:mechanosensitive ion channel family protein [Phycisphaerales bacterium]
MLAPPENPPPVIGAEPQTVTLADRAAGVVNGTLEREFLGNTLSQWITFGAVLLGAFLVVWAIKAIVLARLKRWSDRTSTRIDDFVVTLVSDVRLALIAPGLVLLAARGLTLPSQVERVLHIAAMAGIAVQLVMSSRLLIDFGLKTLANKHRGPDGQPDPTLVSSLGVLRVIAMIVIATVVVLLALDNLNVEIKPLLAGLGIGGIAVALAVQNLLGDLFGSLTILLDKPFVVGDAITVGDKSGTVERIGIKTTRVRATSGEQLVFANSDLLSSRLHNYKRMHERRVAFTFGLTYETDPDLLARVPEMVKAAILAQKDVRFDRCHLKALNTSSVDYEVVYFVTTSDYGRYMDIQQAINLSLLRTFAQHRVEFAYPTQVAIQKTFNGGNADKTAAAAATAGGTEARTNR